MAQRFGVLGFAVLICLGGSILAPTADASTRPVQNVETLLVTAKARGEIIWRTVLETALESFPKERRALLTAAERVAPEWLSEDEQTELIGYIEADIEADAASRARGIWHYLDPALWNGRIDVGGSTSTGDTSERAANLSIHFDRVFAERWKHRLDFSADIGRRQGVTTRERFVTDYSLRYKLTDLVFLADTSRAEFDRFSGYDYRVSTVAGVGLTLFPETDAHNLELQVGAGVRVNRFVSEDVARGQDLSLTEFLARGEAIYQWQINENIRLRNRSTAFFGSNSITLEDEISFSAAINSHLAARLTFLVNYESDAPPGSASVDTATRISLGYSF